MIPFWKNHRVFGVCAVLFYLSHCVYWFTHGRPENMLWACHTGSLLIGIGIFFKRPAFFYIGFFWLGLGFPIWVLYLSSGGEFIFTSFLTHAGGMLAALFFLRTFHPPRLAWVRAFFALVVLHLISRFTPPLENVNLAHRVGDGWNGIFPDFRLYLLFMASVAAASFLLLEFLAKRVSASNK